MIEFKNLTFSYEKEILRDLNFKTGVKRFSITGRSGIGKTTLIKIILGLKKPDKGSVITDFKKISTVFQDDLLIEDLSPLKNIRLVTKKTDREIIELLSKLGIDCPNKKVAGLSGGMKRRVAIARALAYDDFDLLILDEPLKGLDSQTRDTVADLIREILGDRSLLLVSHDKRDLESFEIEETLEL